VTQKHHLIGYVLASEYRKKVVLVLKDKPLTPVMIAEKTSLHASHISNTLSELTKENIVVCLTPKLRKGRLYDLTKDGRNLLENL